MMSDREKYHKYIHEEHYDSSLQDPEFEGERYLTIYGKNRNLFGDIEIYGKVDNLFLTFDSKSNVGSTTTNAYIQGFYFASCNETEDGNFKYFMIFDSVSYHSKFEIEAIKNHCLNIKQEQNN